MSLVLIIDIAGTPNLVHGDEDILVHGVDLHAERFAVLVQQVSQLGKVHRALVDIDQHDHGEHILHDVLRNINDIDPMLIKRLRDLSNDAGAVLADHRDNCAHIFSSDLYIFLE